MRRLPLYVVAGLSCLAVPSLSHTAAAARLTPLSVTELLTSSYVVDLRCRFLSASENRELARYATHAKQAASEIEGTASVLEAVERGHSSGEVAECSPTAKEKTISALAAARRAMAAAASDASDGEQDASAQTARESKREEDLGSYERRMGAYLVDLRCRHLSRRHARQFSALMNDDYRAAIDRFGADAVGLASSRAEQSSSREQCNSQSKELVRSEYLKRTSSLLR